MKFRSIIIDDSPFTIDLLSDLLAQNHPEIEVVARAGSANEGIEKIKSFDPDLVFLDVEMEDMTGFDMLSRIRDIQFHTIFITSYSQYAIKAIRFNALDYLLKPIDEIELANAIKRHSTSFGLLVNKNNVQQALLNMQAKKAEDQILSLQTQQGLLRLALKEIVKIESERNYSFIHLFNQTKVLSSKTLGYFEEILDDKDFYRCHRSFLVNRIHIEKIQSQDSFLLKDDSKVPISRRRGSSAKKWFLNTEMD